MTHPGAADALMLADIAEPAITMPNQIKVRLNAAGVNPIDTKLRRGGVFYADGLPAVLGCDGAGVVVETGAAVTKFSVGDSVWFCHGGLGGEQGNYAEFNVLDERWAVRMPTRLSVEQAAAAPLVLITAWGGLYDRAGLQPGHTVLIHGGSGGVGHVAIQLAKLRGAHVITTVGSLEKAALVKRWGADDIINHNDVDFVAAVNGLTGGRGADVVLDTVGQEVFESSIECTAHFGTLVTLLDAGEANLKEARLRNLRIGFELMLTPMLRNLEAARLHQVRMLAQCAEWIDAGRLHIHVSHILPLAEAANAHRLVETGHLSGKVVLSIA